MNDSTVETRGRPRNPLNVTDPWRPFYVRDSTREALRQRIDELKASGAVTTVDEAVRLMLELEPQG